MSRNYTVNGNYVQYTQRTPSNQLSYWENISEINTSSDWSYCSTWAYTFSTAWWSAIHLHSYFTT